MKKWSAWVKAMAAVVCVSLALPGAVFLTDVSVSAQAESYTVQVSKGYLALRSWKDYDERNELGALYTGDSVVVTDKSDDTYWYVYSPKLAQYGYVNKNYLVYSGSGNVSGTTMTVQVATGYLALRTAKAYDSRNEIGSLYSGTQVVVQDTSDSTYWYVYAPTLGKYGYVNKNYLVGGNVSGTTMTVQVATGYLALRTAKAYDSRNEIGSLYSGTQVVVQDTSDSTYWYVYAPTLGKYGYVNRNYLVGGNGSVSGPTYTVSVATGYLALRTAKAYDSSNEIGALYSGTQVVVQDMSDSTYWYVYAPTLGKYGYVNRNYLIGAGGTSSSVGGTTMKVQVATGYLALRTARAYDSSNEIGELYTGDTVQVQDQSGDTYWYVYSPKHGKYGYVNKNYLVGAGSSSSTGTFTRTVYVNTGYLALRTGKAYDSSNEIGELYTGDTVTVYDTNDGTYWYVYSPKYGRYGYVNKNYLG